MTWLKAIVQLLANLMGWLKDRQLIEAGKATQRAEDTAKNSEIKDAQIKAATDRPADRDDLIARLRKPGGGL